MNDSENGIDDTNVVKFLKPSNCGELGATSKEVGEAFGVTRGRAHQILQDLESEGEVWSSKRGQARIWYAADFDVKVRNSEIVFEDSREGLISWVKDLPSKNRVRTNE